MQLQSNEDVNPEVASWISRAKVALNRKDGEAYQQLLGEAVAIVMELLNDLSAARPPGKRES
jgi:hypothetical protein